MNSGNNAYCFGKKKSELRATPANNGAKSFSADNKNLNANFRAAGGRASSANASGAIGGAANNSAGANGAG